MICRLKTRKPVHHSKCKGCLETRRGAERVHSALLSRQASVTAVLSLAEPLGLRSFPPESRSPRFSCPSLPLKTLSCGWLSGTHGDVRRLLRGSGTGSSIVFSVFETSTQKQTHRTRCARQIRSVPNGLRSTNRRSTGVSRCRKDF